MSMLELVKMGKFNKKRSNSKQKSIILDEETFGYYKHISDSLKGDFENQEDKDLFIDNVFRRLAEEALLVSQDKYVSGTIESLLSSASKSQLTAVMRSFSKDWEKACGDRVASFVLQSLLQGCNKFLEKDENVADIGETLEQLFDELFGFLMSNLALHMQDRSASHIVRVLLEVLAGVKVSDQIIRSKVSTEKKEPVVLKPLSKKYKKMLYHACEQIVCLPKLEDHVQNHLSNPVLQTVLLCTKVMDNESSSNICNKLITNANVFKKTADIKLPDNVTHEVGSHLIEQYLSVMSDEIFFDTWKTHFKGSLVDMAKHPVANFVLQRLISTIRTPAQFEKIFKELSTVLESVLAVNHTGVIVRLAEACVRHKVKQPKFIKGLQKAFHCYDPPERQCKLAPLLITLTTYEIFYKLKDDEDKDDEDKDDEDKDDEDEDNESKEDVNKEGDNNKSSDAGSDDENEEDTEPVLALVTSVNFHGSVIMQNLLQFSNARPVVDSLLELKPAEILNIACDPCGSHVIEAFLKSKTVSEKCHETLYQKLKGCYLKLACNKSGSRTFDSLWQKATLKQKCAIAEELSKQEIQLKGNQFGFFIHSRCSIHHFKQRPQEWKEIQSGNAKKRKLFKDIIEGDVGGPKHAKKS